MDVDGDLRRRERRQLLPAERERPLHLAEDAEVPGREVGRRHGPHVQHGPLLGQVLTGREAPGVVPELAEPRLCSGAEHPLPRLVGVEIVTTPAAVGRRPRAFVRVRGAQAADYLNRMVSNDVLALEPGASCEALLLTPKARVIAVVRVVRRGPEDFLLLTEPELGEIVRAHLARFRFAARCEIEPEEHDSYLLLGPESVPPPDALVVANDDYGVLAFEIVGGRLPGGVAELDENRLERLRIQAGTPRFGNEIDDRVLPAEAGLDRRAVSFTKGCYPGQEPVARLHFRGHPNRELRVLEIDAPEAPEPGSEILDGEKAVGRVTSAVVVDGAVIALGYVRVEVPLEDRVGVNGAPATMTRPTRP